MALELLEGCSHFSTMANGPCRKWDTTSGAGGGYNVVSGRFSGSAIGFTTNFNSWTLISLTQGQLTAVTTRIVGFAFNMSQGSFTTTILFFLDGTSEQVSLRTDGSNHLLVSRNGTTLATSTNAFNTGLWYYIEMSATIGSSTGAYTVKVNGTTWLTASSVNTQATGNATTNGLKFLNTGIGGSGGQTLWSICDIYILNTSGSVNNTFLGECRILTNLPSADDTAATGTNLLWTPNSGSPHFSRVNEAAPDDDTSYVSTQTPGQIDTYKYAAIAASGTIAGTQVVLCERKDDAGSRQTAVEYRANSGTNYQGGNTFVPGSSYLMDRQIFETDPDTAAAWTNSGLNNGEFGMKCVA